MESPAPPPPQQPGKTAARCAMGVAAGRFRHLRRGARTGAAAGRTADRADAGGDHCRHQRRHDPCAAHRSTSAAQAIVGCLIAMSIRPEIFVSFLRRVAAVPRHRRGDAHGEQPARLPDQPLEGAARHHRGVGLDARRSERHGADGGCVRRRRAARRLHAVSARHLRVDGGGADRPAVGRHVGCRAGADRLVPADRLAGFRRDAGHRRGRRRGGRACCAFRPAPFSGR